MKKTYINPTTEVVALNTSSILCASGVIPAHIPVNTGTKKGFIGD